MKFDYDVAIVGLGPAGSTLARLLDKHFKVVAIDKKRIADGGFKKVCGGLLSLDAQEALARFDMTLPKEILADPQIFAVNTIDLKAGLTRVYQRPYVNLDRDKFDKWLMSLVPPHVEIILDGRCESVERDGDGFRLKVVHGGKERVMTAKYVVGADGASSIVRRCLEGKTKTRRYVAIQQWFREGNAKPFYSCVFDCDTSDCCSWSISKDGMFIFGGAFPFDDPRGRFEEQKRKLEKYGFVFGEPIKTEACVVLRPRRMSDFRLGSNGEFLIGEAGGFISPSSLEGISYAMNTAQKLAEIINACSDRRSPNNAYRRAVLPMRIKLMAKVLKCAFMYVPFLRRLVMKSGVQSLDMFNV